MRNRFGTRALLGGALAAGLGLTVIPAPAGAECVYAVVYVTRVGEEAIYVHGPEGCIYPTPWNQAVFLPGHFTLTHPAPPPGAPNGYFIDIRIPVP